MARDATLAVKIISDATKAAKGFQEVETRADRMGRRTAAASKVGAIGLAALGVAAIRGAKAAADDERSQTLLAKAMVNAAGASKTQVSATESWITAQSRATGVADDQLRPALAALVRATGDVTTSQSALKTAMDVSAATGKPLQTVAVGLAKAYAGNTGALARLVPGLSQAAIKSGDMNKIMGELARTTGGSAAAAADTAAGKVAIMSNNFHEAEEALGQALLPALTVLASTLADVAVWAQKHQTIFTVLIGVFAAVAVGMIALNVAFKLSTISMAQNTAAAAANTGVTSAGIVSRTASALVTGGAAVAAFIANTAATIANTAATVASSVAQGVVRVATLAWTAAQWLLNAALLANPLGLFLAAILLVVAAIVLAYKNSETFRRIVGVVAKAVAAYFLLPVKPLMLIVKWITGSSDSAKKARSIISGAFNAMLSPIKAVISAVKSLVSWIGKLNIGKLAKAFSFGLGGPPALSVGGGVAVSGLGGRGGPGDGGAFLAALGGGKTVTVINVEVSGVVGNEDDVARKIESVLRDLTRRRGQGVTS